MQAPARSAWTSRLHLKRVAVRQVYQAWVPLTKTLCQGLEASYPTWMRFVRSHVLGPYSSVTNSTVTANAADKPEEELVYVWWQRMSSQRTGTYPPAPAAHEGNVRGKAGEPVSTMQGWTLLE